MKTLTPLLLLLTAIATPQGDSVGTSPDQHGETLIGEDSAGAWFRVKKGEKHENEDGVKITNEDDSGANADINPKTGDKDSDTKVKTGTGFEGQVDGIDDGDEVDLGSSSEAEVSGTGGEVSVSGGSTVKVTNTNEPPVTGGGTAGAGDSITVILPSGNTLTVPPGSSVTITT
tara:strand:- start:4101 stop:4619 length:519 start_codon:yes stop_codon:yes gene_type:complete